MNEFKDIEIKTTNEIMLYKNDNKWITLGYCLAISEFTEIKRRSFPLVDWIMFDEYMLEPKFKHKYVTGWHEPDLFLNIYHSIDRESDRVKCFLLGNTTEFYNPYHMHKAFKIPYINRGEIWYSENVLFYWSEKSEELKEEVKTNKFLRMITDTDYGMYATDAQFADTSQEFIEKRPTASRYFFTIEFNKKLFGIWRATHKPTVYISDIIDNQCKTIYAISMDDHRENNILAKTCSLIRWLAENYKISNVKFESNEIKALIEPAMKRII